MKTYRHSGTLGDLIYSLSVVKKMALSDEVEFKVAIGNIENCVAQYGYRPDEVDPAHRGRFTEHDYELLEPLLKTQSYIKKVSRWYPGDPDPDVDLDRFRGTLFRGFEGNYVQAYHLAFDMPFKMSDYDATWLEVEPIHIAPIVISRTSRYQDPNGDAQWKDVVKDVRLFQSAVFVGTESEHAAFERAVGQIVPYRDVADFLQLASIIKGSSFVMSNQNFVYSLAMGLGKDTLLETIKIKPLQNNECFFPRKNTQYF